MVMLQATAAAHSAPGLVSLDCMRLLFRLAGDGPSTLFDAQFPMCLHGAITSIGRHKAVGGYP